MAALHFLEFFQKYNGTFVDVDQALGPQCMDLMHRYHMDCLELPDRTILAAPTAKDVYLRAPLGVKGGQYFQKIPNLPWNAPKQGDIIFWSTKLGPAGHVAIVNTANTRRFTSFEQNWGTDKKCRLVEHDYRGVMGWLRFKGPTK